MFRKTFGHTKTLLPPRTNRCNSPRKPWAHILITGPVFSQAWLGLDFITTRRSKHLWVPERCSTLTHVCLLWFPGKTELSCLTGATGCTLGASQRTVLIVHMVPVVTHQLSRAEGSYTYSGVCWETCNTHASTGPGVVTALCWEFAALTALCGCWHYFYKAVILNVVIWGAEAKGSHLPLGRAAQPRTAWAPAVCSSPAHQWSTQTRWWRLPCQWSQLSSSADLKKEKGEKQDKRHEGGST